MFCFMVQMRCPELHSRLGGDKFMSEDEINRESAKFANLCESEKASLHAMMDEYWLEIYDVLDRLNISLLPQAAEKLREKKAHDAANRKKLFPFFEDASDTIDTDLSDIPWMQEVRDICSGTWSGRCHWVEKD